MILADGPLAIGMLLLTPEVRVPVADQPYAITLHIQQRGLWLEVQLIGLSPHTQQISYVLEVASQSTSCHRGSTTIIAGARSVLSTIRAEASGSWSVRLAVEEADRAPYEIVRGSELGSNP